MLRLILFIFSEFINYDLYSESSNYQINYSTKEPDEINFTIILFIRS